MLSIEGLRRAMGEGDYRHLLFIEWQCYDDLPTIVARHRPSSPTTAHHRPLSPTIAPSGPSRLGGVGTVVGQGR